MSASAAMVRAEIERSPRRALMWGGGLLVAGLAAVGVGAADEGAALALGGLLETIFGIHRFGRLGPDEPEPEAPASRLALDHDGAASGPIPRAGLERAAAIDAMWLGGLVLFAGLAIVVGTYLLATAPAGGRVLVPFGAILAGGARFFTAYAAWGQAKARLARAAAAEKRPAAPGGEDEPRPRTKRRRPRRKTEG